MGEGWHGIMSIRSTVWVCPKCDLRLDVKPRECPRCGHGEKE